MNTRLLRAFGGKTFAALLILSASPGQLRAQSVLQFESPKSPYIPYNGVEEDGFIFSAPRYSGYVNGGGLWFRDPPPGTNNSLSGTYTVPYDGTQYASPFTGSEPVLTQTNGLPFALQSFDFAPYSAGYPTNTITVTGYYALGGSIATQLVYESQVQGSLGDFHTFVFNNDWANLTQIVMSASVPVPGGDYSGFSIDNIAVSPIPEPGALTLVGFSVTGLVFARWLTVGRRRKTYSNDA